MIKMSYSKLNTFQSCPFKYKLMYEDGFYIFSDSVATEFGTLIHYLEETMGTKLKNKEPIDYNEIKNLYLNACIEEDKVYGVNILRTKYADDWETKDKNGLTYSEKGFKYMTKSVTRLPTFINSNPDVIVLGVEVPFEFEYRGFKFSGFIDRILYDTTYNTYVIFDVKTYSKPLNNAELDNPLQMIIYDMAARKLYGEDIEIICMYDLPILSLNQECTMSKHFTKYKKLDDLLDKVLDLTNPDNRAPNPTPLCHWCPFCPTSSSYCDESKNLCFYWSHWTPERKIHLTNRVWAGMDVHEQYKKEITNNNETKD